MAIYICNRCNEFKDGDYSPAIEDPKDLCADICEDCNMDIIEDMFVNLPFGVTIASRDSRGYYIFLINKEWGFLTDQFQDVFLDMSAQERWKRSCVGGSYLHKDGKSRLQVNENSPEAFWKTYDIAHRFFIQNILVGNG